MIEPLGHERVEYRYLDMDKLQFVDSYVSLLERFRPLGFGNVRVATNQYGQALYAMGVHPFSEVEMIRAARHLG